VKPKVQMIFGFFLLIGMSHGLMLPLAEGNESRDLLWRVYTEGSQEKKAVLTECFHRLLKVKRRAELATEPVNWGEDPEIAWLLQHRIPTMLAVERELEGGPDAPHLQALIYLTKAIGSRRLLRHLPELLKRTYSTMARLQILRAMSDLRDRGSLAALEGFLSGADSSTPGLLVAEAARGLGLTRNKDYLPLLRVASRMVRSQAESLRMAGAQYRCGDSQIAQRILSVLRDDEADMELRLWAVHFVAEEPVSGVVPVLAELAAESSSEEMSSSALRALVLASGYGVPPGSELLEQKPTQSSEEGTAQEGETTAALPGEGPERLSEKERKKLVQAIMRWWREHQQTRAQQARSVTRKEALEKLAQGVPH